VVLRVSLEPAETTPTPPLHWYRNGMTCLTPTEYVEAKSPASGLLRQTFNRRVAERLASRQMLHAHHELGRAPLSIR
jgi:hypothetical protein